MKIDIDTSEFDNLDKTWRGLDSKGRSRIMANALRAAGRVYRDALAGANFGAKTGNLRRAFVSAHLAARKVKRADRVAAWVAPNKRITKAYHAHLVEHGSKGRVTRKSGANRGRMPALRPMQRALQSSWPSMRNKIEVTVDRGIKRALGR